MAAVSLVLPCRNEEGYIAACLESLAPQLDAADELLVVDGRSDDRTRAIVARFAVDDPRIRLIDNPRRHAAAAMNLGIAAAKGEIIVRVDGHSVYPSNYIQRLVWSLDAYGADNVGSSWRIAPAVSTPKACAIATALAHPFGAGTARFRRATAVARTVDTVPFGCFRRSTFERVGPFREELPVNQDDEFNARLVRGGGTVMLLPDLEVTYCARRRIRDLWRTYFRYGHFKPLALRLSGRPATVRQFVPAAWLITMTGSVAWSVTAGSHLPWMLAWGAYFGTALSIASIDAWRQRSAAFGSWFVVACVSMHLAYAVGWWSGVPRAIRRP